MILRPQGATHGQEHPHTAKARHSANSMERALAMLARLPAAKAVAQAQASEVWLPNLY